MAEVKNIVQQVLSSSNERILISNLLRDQTRESIRRSQEAVSQSRGRLRSGTPCAHPSVDDTTPPTAASPDPGKFMERVDGKSLSDQVVNMDGKHFVDCVLSNCVLEYSGKPVVLETTRFEGCSFRFKGDAAMTLRFCECFNLVDRGRADYQAPSGTPTTTKPN